MAEPTIAAGFAKAFLDFAVSRGAERQTLIERSHIRPDDLKEQDNRIALANYMALMKAGIELCHEPALALLFGEAVRLPDISILGLVGQAERAEQARQQANRYARLAIDDGDGETSDRLEFVREEGKVWLKFRSTVYVDNPLLTESAFARCVCDGRAQPEASAPESASSQGGGSPLQVNALRPVTECNCDAAMRGGEQQEVKDQSVG